MLPWASGTRPTEIRTDTDRWSWRRARRQFLVARCRRAPAHTTAVQCRSGSGRNRRRRASHARHWHWPAYCEPPPNESRDDRAWNFVHAGILRCPAGSLDKSTVRKPYKGTDPGKRLHLELTTIAGDTTTEGGQRKMLHQLCKHQLASVHRWPPQSYASQGRKTRIPSSNRDQENSSFTCSPSTTYPTRKSKRWDSSGLIQMFTNPASDQR